MLDEINQAIDQFGGQWVKLRNKSDGVLKGTIVSAESRGKTFEGAAVLSKKTGKQRTEWVIVLQTDLHESAEDDGVRKFTANESAQRAIAKAVKDSGSKLSQGGTLAIVVTKDPESATDQAEYRAEYAPAAAPVAISTEEVNSLL